MGFEPTTVGCLPPSESPTGIEVRRSFQTELRALTVPLDSLQQKVLGFLEQVFSGYFLEVEVPCGLGAVLLGFGSN